MLEMRGEYKMNLELKCPLCDSNMIPRIEEIQDDTCLSPWIMGWDCECGLGLTVDD